MALNMKLNEQHVVEQYINWRQNKGYQGVNFNRIWSCKNIYNNNLLPAKKLEVVIPRTVP